jgi:hypothetical protein
MSARALTASTSRRCIRGRSSIVLARRAADRLASMRWAYIRPFWPLPMYRTTPSTRIAYTYANRVSEGGRADVCTWVICRRPTARPKARGHFSVPVIAKSRHLCPRSKRNYREEWGLEPGCAVQLTQNGNAISAPSLLLKEIPALFVSLRHHGASRAKRCMSGAGHCDEGFRLCGCFDNRETRSKSLSTRRFS